MSNNVSVEEIHRLSTTVNKLLEDFQTDNTQARKELLIATRSLYLAVETPIEAILRMTWAEVRKTNLPSSPQSVMFVNEWIVR